MSAVTPTYKNILPVALLMLLATHGWSQRLPVENEIKVLTQSYGDSIVIRWAPTTPGAWQMLNQYGYKIERITIVRDSVVLRTDEKVVINSAPIKPAPLERWKNDALKEEIVAVAAQAIYGSSFQVTTARTTSLTDVVNKSREQESRFSFCLFAADISARAAALSGLRFADKTAKRNEKYLYRVHPLVPENIFKIQFGFAYQSTREVIRLPEPRKPVTFPADRGVRIEWDPNPLRSVYNAYYLEKSDDGGKNFVLVRSVPIVPVAGAGSDLQHIVIGDSLRENGKEYFYRLRGTNPFGDKGPYSEPVSVTGIADVKGNASWGANRVTPQNTVVIQWKFDQAWEKDIKHFNVERAAREGGPYLTINPAALPPSTREYEDKTPLSSNYYRIAALGKSGQKHLSTPYLIQLEDSIPPASPGGIVSRIDSTGAVKLNWTPNKESDLLGYHVYRSNFKSSEFARITTAPLTASSFEDTVKVRTLTEKIYYKITAIDKRFNPSPFSDVVELIRPDIIPPVAPVVASVKALRNGISICWVNSSSTDVIRHSIHRRETPTAPWQVIRTFEKNDSTCFVDRPERKTTYQYKIVAEDRSKLSTSSSLFTAKALITASYPPVADIKSEADRTNKLVKLTWTYKERNVIKYLVYRSEAGGTLALYGSLPGTASGFSDLRPALNTNYSYRIKAVFSDGLESAFSEEVKVQY